MKLSTSGYGSAYAELATNTVYIPASLIAEYRAGKYNYNQLLHVAAHECGHLSVTGKDKAYNNDTDSEAFADFYGLLLLEEMQHDGKNIDLYDVIKRFLIRNAPAVEGDNHGSDLQRYQALKAKLDYWKATKGRKAE